MSLFEPLDAPDSRRSFSNRTLLKFLTSTDHNVTAQERIITNQNNHIVITKMPTNWMPIRRT